MKQFFTLFLLSTLSLFSFAQSNLTELSAPSNCIASPDPLVITQADQTQITVVGKGNMNNNWTESVDGYTIVKNSNGIYEYAHLVNGDLQASGVKARDPQQRTTSELSFVSSLTPSIKPMPNALKGSVLNQVRKQIQNKTYPTTGSIRVLALLIEYPDLQSTFLQSDFDSLFGGVNYPTGHGSFKTYFETASSGQLTVTVDVMGWFMADSNYRYYSDSAGTPRAADLVREAVDAAELAGANFSNYDNDNDGDVDGILTVHSGPGAEVGSQTQYIWSHRWVLNGGSQGSVFYDGVWINDYMINPETRGTLSNPRIVGIGVLCHEFGHNLGLPDLYDTNQSNGDSEGIGNWGLMGGGGWLGGEHFPANFCAWSRVENGWDTPTSLTIGNSGNYTMNPASLNQNEMYRINTQNSNEYFLLENRQKRGLDSMLNGTGLAIWHINTSKTNMFQNQVNGDETEKGVDLEEADGNDDLDNEINRGDNGDLFPGSTNNRIFNDNTYPSAETYTPSSTGLFIRNITETGNQINFDFGAPVVASCSGTTTLTQTSGSFSDGSGSANYTNNLNCSWLLQPTSTVQNIALGFNAADIASGDTLYIYDGSSSSSPLIGAYSSSTTLPVNISSTGPTMFLQFITDGSGTDQGWDVSYTGIPPATCTGNITMTATSGTFDDGSTTTNYTNNLNCSWLIQPSSPVNDITLTFSAFSTVTPGDTVFVYDGTDNTAPLMGSYTGNLTPFSLTSTGASMYVEFKTNFSITSTGWDAAYSTTPFSVDTMEFTQDTIFIGSGLGSSAQYNIRSNANWSVTDNAAWLVTSPLNGSGNQSGTATATQPNFGPPRTAMVYGTSANGSAKDTLVVIQSSGGNYLMANPDSLYFPFSGGQEDIEITSNVSWQLNSPSAVPIFNPTNGSNDDTVQVSLPANNTNNRLVYTSIISSSAPNTSDDTVFLVQDPMPNAQLSLDRDSLILNHLASSQGTFTINSNVVWQATSPANWLIVNVPSVTQDTNSVIIEALTSNFSGQNRFTYVAVQDVNSLVFDTLWVKQTSGSVSLSFTPSNVTLMQPAFSSASVSLTSNTAWTTTPSSAWISVTPAADSGDVTLNIEALGANNLSSIRKGYVAVSDTSGTVKDTIWVDQLGVPKQLSVSPSNIVLGQAAASRDSFMVNSNVVWQNLAGDPWLTVVNPNNTSDTNKVYVVANTANTSTNLRSSFVAVMDTSGSLHDTVWVDQLGTAPILNASQDTIILASPVGSSNTVNLAANNDWFAVEGDNWFSATPLNGNSSANILIEANTANNGGSLKVSYLAFADTVNNLNDTVIIIQDTNSIQGLSTNPDTIRLNSFAGSTSTYDIIAPAGYQWTTYSVDNWVSLDQSNGAGAQRVNVTATSANNSINNRLTYIVTTESSLPMTFDTVVVIQEGVGPNLDVNPKVVSLNFAAGSNDQLQLSSNIDWTVNNPVSWLNVSPSADSGNTTVSITASTANLSGSIRTANLVFSAAGVPDVLVKVNQVDGSSPSFTVSRDTVYVDNPQGSTSEFSVLANSANWSLSESTPWLLINPTTGNNTQKITVLAASRNVYGTPRYATITASDPNFNDTTVVVVQRATTPLFQVSPSEVRLGGDSGSFTTFNISSNLQNWTISKDSSWIDVTPSSGSFTQQVRVTAVAENKSGAERIANVSIFAPPLTPQTVMVRQDTVWSIGLNENMLSEVFTLYPNPTNGELYIETDADVNVNEIELAIYNNLGARVQLSKQVLGSNRLLINMQNAAAGFYYIHLNYEGKQMSKKISILGQR